MATPLHWVQGPWPGRLALASRPRGGDWLTDELRAWQLQGVHGVVSLLEPGEAADLDLQEEASEARAHGLKFVSFPIHDRSIPDSEARFQDLVDELGRELSSGRNIVLHCRQGVGRTGLVAAGLLLSQAMSVDSAVKLLTSVRGVSIPETVEQLRWLEHYAVNLEPAR